MSAVAIVNRVPKTSVSDAICAVDHSQSDTSPAAIMAATKPTIPAVASDSQPRRAPSSRPAMNVTSPAASGPMMIQATAVMIPLRYR